MSYVCAAGLSGHVTAGWYARGSPGKSRYSRCVRLRPGDSRMSRQRAGEGCRQLSGAGEGGGTG